MNNLKKISGIYKITNIVNGKFYIGSSIDVEKRWRQHKNKLKNNNHTNIHLQRSWNKYGENSFSLETIEEVGPSSLLDIEQLYLDKLCPFHPNGYNIGVKSWGGDNFSNHPNKKDIVKRMQDGVKKWRESLSDEDKKRISYNLKGDKNPNFGNKWSKELRNRVGKTRKDMITPQDRENTSNRMKTLWSDNKYKEKMHNKFSEIRKGENNHFYGKHHSKKTKKLLSKIHKEKCKAMTPEELYNHNPQIRKVQINGIIYFGVSEAARQINVCPGTIIHRIKSPNLKYKDYHYID